MSFALLGFGGYGEDTAAAPSSAPMTPAPSAPDNAGTSVSEVVIPLIVAGLFLGAAVYLIASRPSASYTPNRKRRRRGRRGSKRRSRSSRRRSRGWGRSRRSRRSRKSKRSRRSRRRGRSSRRSRKWARRSRRARRAYGRKAAARRYKKHLWKRSYKWGAQGDKARYLRRQKAYGWGKTSGLSYHGGYDGGWTRSPSGDWSVSKDTSLASAH